MAGQLLWTDQLGRTYEYTPFQAQPIADETFTFSADATLAVSEGSTALGSVPTVPASGVAAVLYRSEVSASSLIEGVGPGPRRILEVEFAGGGEVDDEDAHRVVANLEALRDAFATEIPARPGDLLRWHRKLMEGQPMMSADTIGAFRTVQNWIGGDASGPRSAAFIPPQPEKLADLIDDLVAFCGRTDLTPVAHAAIAHAQFEVIHPFTDGNGRIGRLLIQQLLRRRLQLPSPVPVSVVWARDTDRYIDGLRAYQAGEVDDWVGYFGVSVVGAVGWMTEITDRVAGLIADFRSRVETRGESVAARVIEDLPEHPLVDTQSVAVRYSVAPQSAHAALVRLEGAGILTERPFARRRRGRPRRVFAATELIDLLA